MYSSLDKDARNIIKIIEEERVAGGGALFSLDEKMYVHIIVSGFKNIGIWESILALWGMVGGTAASHKWNWVDMRNLSAAFVLNYVGGITHNNLGFTANGSNGYADTNIRGANINVLSTGYILYYGAGTGGATGNFFGFRDFTVRDVSYFGSFNTGAIFSSVATDYQTRFDFTNTTTTESGCIAVIKNSSQQRFFKNTILRGTQFAYNDAPNATTPFYLGATYATPNIGFGGSRNIRTFVKLKNHITDTQVTQAQNILIFAQGILNRR